jgi:hypothetical protein
MWPHKGLKLNPWGAVKCLMACRFHVADRFCANAMPGRRLTEAEYGAYTGHNGPKITGNGFKICPSRGRPDIVGNGVFAPGEQP